MSFGGHAQDMFNRFKYNRSIRPNQKPKFKESYREGIYSEVAPEKKDFLDLDQKFSPEKTAQIIEEIKLRAKAQKRKTIWIYLFYLFLVALLLVMLFQYHGRFLLE